MSDGTTHWDGCHLQHLSCAVARVEELERQLAEANRLLERYQKYYVTQMAYDVQRERATQAEAERDVLRARLNWCANELLACDYGDNDGDCVGWIVFGWRDVNGIHSVVPPERIRRIYGASIDAALDAARNQPAQDTQRRGTYDPNETPEQLAERLARIKAFVDEVNPEPDQPNQQRKETER